MLPRKRSAPIAVVVLSRCARLGAWEEEWNIEKNGSHH